MKKTFLFCFIFTILLSCKNSENKNSEKSEFNFLSGTTWLDTEGKPIEAHGGGILLHEGTYYWYGENHALGKGNKTGVSCYSSKDLKEWKNEGVVLPKDSLPIYYRDSGVCERPKVIFNEATRKFVMWMHLDAEDYTHAFAGIAVADGPASKFKFVKSMRPLKFDYKSSESGDRIAKMNEKGLGNTLRDMNLFVDKDQKAYIIYASENNVSLYIARLNREYTDVERPDIEGKTWIRALPFQMREAPAPFKYNGKYYMITSGLTGWLPNPAQMHIADSMLGSWKTLGNPCIGPLADMTFNSQSTFVLHAPGQKENCFIFMADRWHGNDLQKSSFVWLPFVIQPEGNFVIQYLDQWNFDVFESSFTELEAPILDPIKSCSGELTNSYKLVWKKVKAACNYSVLQNGKTIHTTTKTEIEIRRELAGRAYNYSVIANNLSGGTSKPSDPVTLKWCKASEIYLSETEPDFWKQGWGLLQYNKPIEDGKITIVDKKFEKGLGTHAPSEIVYFLNGHYEEFQCYVGVDAFPAFSDKSLVEFLVYVDGKLAFQSGLMNVKSPSKLCKIKVTKANILKLIATDGGNGQDWDHANWAEAKLTTK